MLLQLFGFLQLSLASILDILVVALVFFLVFRWLRGSSAANIVLALLFLLVMQAVAKAIKMEMVSSLLSAIFDVGVLALIIIFQPEIRHFLNRIGSQNALARRGATLLNRLFGLKADQIDNASVNEITEACRVMSTEKCGALIVLPHQQGLSRIIETGDRIDAAVHRRLIRNIFFKNSPLHDGAMVIAQNRIAAARCTLPVSENPLLPPHFGMRHKAAAGMSEESDADVIVVSEQTGAITLFHGGQWTPIQNSNELRLKLNAAFNRKENDTPAQTP